jgi:hypothetical protein
LKGAVAEGARSGKNRDFRPQIVDLCRKKGTFDVDEVSIKHPSENATMSDRKTDMSDSTLESILLGNRVPAAEWNEWKALVFFGVRPSKPLLARLHRGNRKKAFDAILAELSKGLEHRFPPADWQPSSRRKAS